jgi:hypothetical protein
MFFWLTWFDWLCFCHFGPLDMITFVCFEWPFLVFHFGNFNDVFCNSKKGCCNGWLVVLYLLEDCHCHWKCLFLMPMAYCIIWWCVSEWLVGLFFCLYSRVTAFQGRFVKWCIVLERCSAKIEKQVVVPLTFPLPIRPSSRYQFPFIVFIVFALFARVVFVMNNGTLVGPPPSWHWGHRNYCKNELQKVSTFRDNIHGLHHHW